MKLTVNEAADVLRRSPRFVRDEIRREKLTASLIGGSYRIDQTELDAYIAQREGELVLAKRKPRARAS